MFGTFRISGKLDELCLAAGCAKQWLQVWELGNRQDFDTGLYPQSSLAVLSPARCDNAERLKLPQSSLRERKMPRSRDPEGGPVFLEAEAVKERL